MEDGVPKLFVAEILKCFGDELVMAKALVHTTNQ